MCGISVANSGLWGMMGIGKEESNSKKSYSTKTTFSLYLEKVSSRA
jgi:hypothetical protein